MKPRTKDLVTAVLAAGAVALALYSFFAGRAPKVELGTYEALGAITAEETATLLGLQGQVLVIARDTGPDKNPSVESGLAAFQRTLRKHGGVSQVSERFEATPMMMMATGGGVPAEHLLRALRSHAEADALVLFCPLPPLGDAEAEMLQRRGVKIVVVSSFRPHYRPLLDRQLIHRVIAPRPDGPPAGVPPPRTLRERFDQEFVVVAAGDAVR